MDLLQQPIILIIGFALFGYLLGSVSTAIITCKLMGLADPRTVGSNNPGATNVLREGGKKAAAITLFGDMLKGLVPVLIAVVLDMPDEVIAATGVAAFLGHLYPVFYGFKGGKGVATILGVLLGIHWQLGLGTILIWLAMASTVSLRWRRWIRPMRTPSDIAKGAKWNADPSPPTITRAAR